MEEEDDDEEEAKATGKSEGLGSYSRVIHIARNFLYDLQNKTKSIIIKS